MRRLELLNGIQDGMSYGEMKFEAWNRYHGDVGDVYDLPHSRMYMYGVWYINEKIYSYIKSTIM